MNMEHHVNDLESNEFARDVLGRLAATMPDNPGRVAAVQRIVRRRRRRRVATRATLGLASAAGVGFVVVNGATRQPQTLPAASPTVPPGDSAPTAGVPDTVPVTSPDPCAVAKATTGPGDATSTLLDNQGRMKAAGTITAIDGERISVSVEQASIEISDVTATFAADTTYGDAGQPSSGRPQLGIGDPIAFSAVVQPDGSYVIDHLEAHMPDAVQTPEDATKPSAPPRGSDVTNPTFDGWIKVTGTITAVNGSTISVSVEQASIVATDVTATVSVSTTYRDAGQTSSTRPELAIGDRVAFSAVPQPDGSYLIDQLETHMTDIANPADTDPAGAAAKQKRALAECGSTTG